MNREVSDDVIMMSLNMFRHWLYPIIHIKFGEDWMRNGQVIVQNVPFSSIISEPWSQWWRHHNVISWCSGSNLTYLHSKGVRNALKRKHIQVFARNQWTVKLVMTSSWRHWICSVTDPNPSFISSLMKIGWEMTKLLCKMYHFHP